MKKIFQEAPKEFGVPKNCKMQTRQPVLQPSYANQVHGGQMVNVSKNQHPNK